MLRRRKWTNTGLGYSEQMAGFVASYGVKNNLCRADRENSINRNSAKGDLITLCLCGTYLLIIWSIEDDEISIDSVRNNEKLLFNVRRVL